MFSSLSIGNTNLNAQFQSIFGQGECKMEIRKLDPSNPEDAKLLNTLDDELYQGEDNFDDMDEEEDFFPDPEESDIDDDMDDTIDLYVVFPPQRHGDK